MPVVAPKAADKKKDGVVELLVLQHRLRDICYLAFYRADCQPFHKVFLQEGVQQDNRQR